MQIVIDIPEGAFEVLTTRGVDWLGAEHILSAVANGKPYEERKKGKWIYHIDDLFPAESTKECDQCRTHQDLNCDGNFCPWCGAKMEVSVNENGIQ